jgi:hypothetical protein
MHLKPTDINRTTAQQILLSEGSFYPFKVQGFSFIGLNTLVSKEMKSPDKLSVQTLTTKFHLSPLYSLGHETFRYKTLPTVRLSDVNSCKES